MSSTKTRTATAAFSVLIAGLLLTGCGSAGAQSSDPVAKVPGSVESATSTDASQRNSQACGVASSATVDAIDTAVGGHDNVDTGSVRKGDGGWYVAASVVPDGSDDPNEDEVGVWATTTDPTAEDFDGDVMPVNKPAKDASDGATPAADPFSASSAAAKAVTACTIDESDR